MNKENKFTVQQMVNHDLRTALTIVDASVQEVLFCYGNDPVYNREKIIKYSKLIDKYGREMSSILNSLIDSIEWEK